MDVIKANRPIVILDEPQKMGGTATQESLKEFNPLFSLNYSATHKQHHTLVYVLDALDAYNKQLVNKIEVKGFDILFNTPYEQYLRNIEVHKTHAGYFSIDKKGRKVDSPTKRNSDESDDISAYDLILKDKYTGLCVYRWIC